jgi:hypothetical protein
MPSVDQALAELEQTRPRVGRQCSLCDADQAVRDCIAKARAARPPHAFDRIALVLEKYFNLKVSGSTVRGHERSHQAHEQHAAG